VNAVDDTTRTALHEAAEHGNLSTVKILLENGADVDANDIWHWTPLHRAATQGGWQVVDALIRHGANITLKASGRKTSLDLACDHGQLEIIRLLIRNLGGTLPPDFSASMIEFWGVPMATRIEIQKILQEHLHKSSHSNETEYAEQLAEIRTVLCSSMEAEPRSSDPSYPDHFFNQQLVANDLYGFPVKVGMGAASSACTIM
jgi:ankyrin repeat protein